MPPKKRLNPPQGCTSLDSFGFIKRTKTANANGQQQSVSGAASTATVASAGSSAARSDEDGDNVTAAASPEPDAAAPSPTRSTINLHLSDSEEEVVGEPGEEDAGGADAATPPPCWTPSQWTSWKAKYPWLFAKEGCIGSLRNGRQTKPKRERVKRKTRLQGAGVM